MRRADHLNARHQVFADLAGGKAEYSPAVERQKVLANPIFLEVAEESSVVLKPVDLDRKSDIRECDVNSKAPARHCALILALRAWPP